MVRIVFMSEINTINDLINDLNNSMDNIDKYQIEYIIGRTLRFIISGAVEH